MKLSARPCVLTAVTVATLALAPSAFANTFSNAAAIEIDDEAPASPYPSTIAVTGMVGEITDVNVILTGLSHTHLDDVAVVVQSPDGSTLLLMNGVGPIRSPSDPTSGVTDIDLTLDDGAGSSLQTEVVPSTGSFRPANHSGIDSFTGAGPGSSYGNPGPGAGGSATLASSFNAIDANGGWKLFVHDFAQEDVGEIAGGWIIDVTTDGTDNTGPVTAITSGPDGTISQSSASFGFAANEVATFECRLDSQAYASCTDPKGYAGLGEGSHTFTVRGTDLASNVGSAATRTFTVDIVDPPPPTGGDDDAPPSGGGGAADSSPPIVSIASLKLNMKKRSAKLAFSATDDVTAAAALIFTCRIDRRPVGPCGSPKTYKKLTPGKHAVEVRAADAAGNSGAAVKRFKIKKPAKRK